MESSTSRRPEPHPDLPEKNKIDHYLEVSSNPSQHIRHIPIELINKILLKLPIKSLERFMCVSQSWLSLISSQQFIETHLAVASERDDSEHHRLIFRVYKFPDCDIHYRTYSVYSLLHGLSSDSEIAIPNKVIEVNHLVRHDELVWPVSSCNGLVCMRTSNGVLFLCNPCTKRFKKLPQTGQEYKRHGFVDFGLGYDKLNEDYKVVGLYMISDLTEIRMYSLKNDSWRNLNLRVRGTCTDSCLQYANGNMFWRTGELPRSIGGGRDKIARFDLANESYGEMDLPDTETTPDVHKLGVLGDRISLFYIYGKDHADIWIMKDSWTKVGSIHFADHPAKDSYMQTQLICSIKNGQILFVLGSYFLLYNPKTDTYKSYRQEGTIGNVLLHVESLVSL